MGRRLLLGPEGPVNRLVWFVGCRWVGRSVVASWYLDVFADLDGTHFESVLSIDGDLRLISFNFMMEWLKEEQFRYN